MAGKNIKGITIEIDGDTSGLTQALKKVDGETKKVQTELGQVERLLKFDPSNVELLSQKQKLLGDAIDGTSKRLDALKQAQSEVERQFQSGEIGEEAYRKFQREIIATEGKLKAFQSQADAVKVKLDAQVDTSGLDKMKQKLDEVADKAKEVGDKMKDVGTEMSTKVSAPIAAFGTGALLAAGQFDNAAGHIQAALGVTADEADKLESKARNVWKAGFGESLEEVTNALVRVKQNIKGISDEAELEKVTQDALALAKTFDSDVVEVTRAANNIMVNFGVTSQEAFDLLAYGAQNGLNFSNELFDNVAEYSGLFSTLGFEADEYFQILQKGSEAGVYNLDYLNDVIKEFGIRIKDGSTSTMDALSYLYRDPAFDDFITNLQNGGKATKEFMALAAREGKKDAEQLVEDLQKGGKAAEKAYDYLMFNMGKSGELITGLSDGSIRGADAMQDILVKIRDLEDPMERAQIGVALFGTKWEDLEETAMFSLIGVNGELEGLDENMKKVTDAQEQTFGQRWDNLVRSSASSLEPVGKVLLDFAEQWLPKIIAMVESLANWFSNLSPIIQVLVVAFGAIVAAIGPFLVIIGAIISAIGNIIPVVLSIIGHLKNFSLLIGGLSGPVGIAIAAITALIAIGVVLYKNWDEISAFLTSCWENIKSVASTVFSAIGDFLSNIWDGIKSIVETVWNGISSFFKSIWDGIKSIFDSVMKSIKSSLDNYWNSMKDGIKTVWDGIVSIFKGVWEVIKNVFVGTLLVILDLLTGNWEDAKSHTEQIWKNIQDALKNVWEGIKKVFSGTLDAILGYVKTSWDNIKNATSTAFNNVKSTISTIWESIKSFVSNTITSMVSTVTNKFNDIVNSVRNKMNDVQTTIKDIWEKVTSFFEGINLYDIGMNIIQGLIDGIGSMKDFVMDIIEDTIGSAINFAKKLLGIKSPSRVFMEIGEFTNEGFIKGIESTSKQLQNAVGSVYGSLSSSAQKSAQIATSSVTSSTSTINNSKYMQPSITIINQGGNMSPAQQARQALNAQRQLAMEWGI